MGGLDGRVAIVTGAGRGIGREHALLLAHEGASVVVNDLGAALDGSEGDSGSPAQEVADEIVAAGGQAIVNGEDVADWAGAEKLVSTAIDTFGGLHVLVNNAGIIRDRFCFKMSEHEWDDVINVHLKGHFAPLRHAAAYWRERSKSGEEVSASVINTTSGAGLFGNLGQTNYGAAKAGIVGLTTVASQELARYGVRVNAITPMARTRMTLAAPGVAETVKPPEESDRFDPWDPTNVSPLVAYLATADCPFTGTVFHVFGGQVGIYAGWRLADTVETSGTWDVSDLAEQLRPIADARGSNASEGMSGEEFGKVLANAMGA